MKKIILITIFFFTIINAKDLKQDYKVEINFGFLSNQTLLQNFKDSRVALSLWLKQMGENHNSKLTASYFNSLNEIYNEYFNNNILDCIVIPSLLYFQDKGKIEEISDSFWSVAISGSEYKQYYLISKKSKGFKSIKDIKNKTIALKQNVAKVNVWLDKKSLEINKKPYEKIVLDTIKKRKESAALLDVYFKKVDFAVVTSHTWDTMIELNPSLEKSLKIVDKSKKIYLQFIGFFKKNYEKEPKDVFFKASEDLKSIPKGEQIMTMLKFDYVFKLKEKDLKELNKFYQDYYELKKRYN